MYTPLWFIFHLWLLLSFSLYYCFLEVFIKFGNSPAIISPHSWYPDQQILAPRISELWPVTPTQRDHLTVLGSPSQKETASGRTLGQLSGFLRLFPFSQDQSRAACCPVCENSFHIFHPVFQLLKAEGEVWFLVLHHCQKQDYCRASESQCAVVLTTVLSSSYL